MLNNILKEAKLQQKEVLLQTDDGKVYRGTIEEIDNSRLKLRNNESVWFIPVLEVIDVKYNEPH